MQLQCPAKFRTQKKTHNENEMKWNIAASIRLKMKCMFVKFYQWRSLLLCFWRCRAIRIYIKRSVIHHNEVSLFVYVGVWCLMLYAMLEFFSCLHWCSIAKMRDCLSCKSPNIRVWISSLLPHTHIHIFFSLLSIVYDGVFPFLLSSFLHYHMIC